MKYIVIFFEEYVGYHFDEHSKIFSDKKRAKRYCQDLNFDFAGANMCAIEDLGDYYVVQEVKED